MTDINSVKIMEGAFLVIDPDSPWQGHEDETNMAAARGIAVGFLLSAFIWTFLWILGRLGGAW